MAGVDEGVQAHVADRARQTGRHGAVELAHHALGKVVGLDPVAADQLLHEGKLQSVVAADDPADQALVGQVVEAMLRHSADAGGVQQGEVAWPGLREETGFERHQDRFRDSHAAGAADEHRCAVADQPGRARGIDDRIAHFHSPV